MKAGHHPVVGDGGAVTLRRGVVVYCGAILAAVGAWLLRAALDPYLLNLQPFATFYVAVTLIAWWGGWRPAVASLIVGYFLAHWSFLPPRHTLGIEDVADVVQHLAYFFVTGTIVLLMELLGRSRARAAATARAAEQSELRFRTMAETVPEIILGCRSDGFTEFANQRLFEYAGAAASAKDWHELIHPDDSGAAEAHWQECLRTGRDFEIECRLRAGDGSYRWFLHRARATRDANGRIVNWVGCCTEIEGQKRNAEMLEEKVAERTLRLQEALEEMEHLSYSIVHDLRAPLRAMSGYAEVLQNELCAGCLRPSNLDYLRRIRQASTSMDRMIQDVLSYSGAVRQSLPLHPVDLAALLEALIHTYPHLLACKSHIEVPTDLPMVLGNEAALTQCFGNLLENAIKFVGPGVTPVVRVWGQPFREWVRVWVEDNGIGIPRSASERIFDLFQRAAPPGYQGTGLGLAIARKLAERMDGGIGVDSEPGKGSRFWVELHLAKRESAVAAE